MQQKSRYPEESGSELRRKVYKKQSGPSERRMGKIITDSSHKVLAAGMVAGFIIVDQSVKYVHFRSDEMCIRDSLKRVRVSHWLMPYYAKEKRALKQFQCNG